MLRNHLRAYLIADFGGREPEAVFEAVSLALAGGIGTVQYRDKTGASSETRRERARRLLALTKAHGAFLVVNDDVELALRIGADGVHLGPEDEAVDAVRVRVPVEFLIGGSAGSVDTARSHELAGADYVGCGAVFDAAASKANASAPRGVDFIRSIAEAVSIPVVGIGGITLSNASSVMEAGAAGVAVIRAILDAEDPRSAAERLLMAHASSVGDPSSSSG